MAEKPKCSWCGGEHRRSKCYEYCQHCNNPHRKCTCVDKLFNEEVWIAKYPGQITLRYVNRPQDLHDVIDKLVEFKALTKDEGEFKKLMSEDWRVSIEITGQTTHQDIRDSISAALARAEYVIDKKGKSLYDIDEVDLCIELQDEKGWSWQQIADDLNAKIESSLKLFLEAKKLPSEEKETYYTDPSVALNYAIVIMMNFGIAKSDSIEIVDKALKNLKQGMDAFVDGTSLSPPITRRRVIDSIRSRRSKKGHRINLPRK